MANTRSLAGESLSEEAAEGATAPETLRQKDRDRVMNFWKVRRPKAVSTEGVTRPSCDGARFRGNLSGPMTEGPRFSRARTLALGPL